MEPPDYVVHTVTVLLAVVIGAQVLAVVGRGLGCVYWGARCTDGDFKLAMDSLSSLTATVVALVFALLKK